MVPPTGTQTEQGNLPQKRCDLKNVGFLGGTIYIYNIYIYFFLSRSQKRSTLRRSMSKFEAPIGYCLSIVPNPTVKRNILHAFTTLDKFGRRIIDGITAIHASDVCT